MKWEKDAEKAMDKVPFFVRRVARKKVEDHVRLSGRDTVTLQDVHDARSAFAQGGVSFSTAPVSSSATTASAAATSTTIAIDETPVGSAAPDQPSAKEPTEGGITESQIRRIEELVERVGGYETRFWSVKVCGGAVGCPLTQFDVQRMADEFKDIIDDSGLSHVLEGRIRGPVLSHHKFKVAIAGCPNNCSETHIRDFAVSGEVRPGPGPGDCIECGQCETACKEGAVKVNGRPHIDRSLCVGCGDCAAACPTQALVIERGGYTVMVGGKLGRHPQLATSIIKLADEETVYRALRASIKLLREEGRGGERLGGVLNRVGLERLLRMLH